MGSVLGRQSRPKTDPKVKDGISEMHSSLRRTSTPVSDSNNKPGQAAVVLGRFTLSTGQQLALIVALAFLLRLLPATVRFVIGSDDALFLTLGQNLAAGRGYTGDGLTTQIDFPPGYPLFAAAIFALGGGPEWPTWVNMLAVGSLLPVAIYWLARQLTDARTGLLAGLLAALHPALVLGQGNFESVAEPLYSLLLYTGWGLVWWGVARRRVWPLGLAGLLIGLAHWVRWEGIILGLIGAVMVAGLLRRERRLLPALGLYLAGLLLCAIPFGLFLYRHTGSVLSPKTMLTQLHAAAIDATASDPWAFERSFYEQYERWLAHPAEPPPALQQSRWAAVRRYVGNVWVEIRLWFTALSFLTVLWIGPFLIGLWRLPWRRMLFLLPLFIPLGFIPASVVDPRYFLIPLPVILIFVAVGLVWLTVRLPSRYVFGRNLLLGGILTGGLLAAFVAASLAGSWLYPRPTGYRTAGLALRGDIPPGAHFLARKRQVAYYAGGVWDWLPLANLDAVLAHARARHIDYLVVDSYTTPSLRPQLAFLLNPAAAPADLQPVYVSPEVVVYRITSDE